jgi:hypothetical protein
MIDSRKKSYSDYNSHEYQCIKSVAEYLRSNYCFECNKALERYDSNHSFYTGHKVLPLIQVLDENPKMRLR